MGNTSKEFEYFCTVCADWVQVRLETEVSPRPIRSDVYIRSDLKCKKCNNIIVSGWTLLELNYGQLRKKGETDV